MATSTWGKFKLLMWKNWLLIIRNRWETFLEFTMPLVFIALLVLVRVEIDYVEEYKETKYQSFELDSNVWIQKLTEADSQMNLTLEIAYTPVNDYYNRIIKRAADKLSLPYVGVDNRDELEKRLLAHDVLVGVVFDGNLNNVDEQPKSLKYELRYPSELRSFRRMFPNEYNWKTNLLTPPFNIGGPRNKGDEDGGLPPGYLRESFLTIQNAIAYAIFEEKSQNVPVMFIGRFPYPEYKIDLALAILKFIMALIILLSFIYLVGNTVRHITLEKERQLKEVMKIMGLSNWLHWTAWFTRCMIISLIIISYITLCFTYKWSGNLAIFTHSNWVLVWIFFFLYSLAAITFCFLLSSVFSKAVTASTVSGFLWFAMQIPYMAVMNDTSSNLSLGVRLILCLFCNSAMGFGLDIFIDRETHQEGVQWNNLWSPASPDDNISLGIVMVMLIICSILYLLLALYLEKLFPGEYGIPEKWYFPFSAKYWTHNKVEMFEDYEAANHTTKQLNDNFEKEPKDLRAGIQIKNLRKVYGKNKIAVAGLTANMYKDQITVLLGHNGAGKTTTMCMLTGMFPPTSGTAVINDYDIKEDMYGVRESLSICPQHNILFDQLTVKEHIIFYCKLKGLDDREIKEEIDKYVNLLELQPKINAQSKTLSGGMKRKLSVGVALCGRSRVVLLDEPTSGMDPAARRALWNLLQREKKNRTILLSTHFMDEADILGDRIAILAEGDLKCCGSSFFLKKKFGIGYHLVCVKKSGCFSSDVTKLIAKHIPNVSVECDIGHELSYPLPDNESHKFKALFTDLENNKEELGVLSFGVSLTTLEEVFLKTGADLSIDEIDSDSTGDLSNNGNKRPLLYENNELLTGWSLKRNHIIAILKKKMISSYRHWIILLFQLLLPTFVITLSKIASGAVGKTTQTLPALLMDLTSYGKSVTVLSSQNTSTTDDLSLKLANEYGKIIKPIGTLEQTSRDIEDYILEVGSKGQYEVDSHYMLAASILPTKLVAFFNNQFYHTASLSLNILHKAIMRALFGEEYTLEVVNHPLPYSVDTKFKMLAEGNNSGFQTVMNIGFGMAFVAALFVIFCIKERVCRAKLLQFVSGVQVFIFWGIAYLWDLLILAISVIITIIALAILQIEGWSTASELGKIFILLILFAISIIPLVYIASLCFSVPASGYTRLTMIFFLSGVGFFLTIFVLGQEELGTKATADKLLWIFYFFPHFNLLQGLENFNSISTNSRICNQFCEQLDVCDPDLLCQLRDQCCHLQYFTFDKTGLNWSIVYFLISAFIGFVLLLILEYRLLDSTVFFIKSLLCRRKPPLLENDGVDEDVMNEVNAVHNMNPGEYAHTNLVIKDMTKYYKKFLAVNQLCVRVNHTECFGLLGVNGAGKTTTFKMLTGDLKISSGDAFVTGISHINNINLVHRHIGYCPQFDALLDSLTGRQMLELFCLLRGVHERKIKSLSEYLALELGFTKHLDKQVSQYSGGTKRKLSTAIALIGDPIVVYLDEPTTGMDPAAKRVLWNLICKVRDSGKSIVLTSHSMEECEALCTRLAIMVNGEFKCLGSSQHLKSKFSKGFVLTIKLEEKTSSTYGAVRSRLDEYLQSQFNGVELREEFGDKLTYYIADNSVSWSTMFGVIEDAKNELKIKDYSVSQTSLEEVFLSFTKYQIEGRDDK